MCLDNGDPVFLIPEHPLKSEKEKGVEYYIGMVNIGEWARKFANQNNTVTIFLFSACRIKKEKMSQEAFSKIRPCDYDS